MSQSDIINSRQIQWFPGHMTKTLRLMEKEIRNVDCVLQILDARIPLSSLNPEIERITAGKPHLYVLNKSDLADPEITKQWLAYFKSAGAGCIAMDSKQRGRATATKGLIEKELSALMERRRSRGMVGAAIRVMIVGIPNVGKSTLLNALLKEDRALVSDIAGTTRDVIEETLNIDGLPFRFIDTAGIRETDDPLESMGIERTYDRIGKAAVVLLVADARDDAEEISALYAGIPLRAEQRLIIVLNKCDRLDAQELASKQATLRERISVPVEWLSAKFETHLDGLLRSLRESVRTDDLDNAGATVVFNARHHEALLHASESLARARQGIEEGLPGDLLSQDIREVLHHLGTITGEITTNDILGSIFSRFCVGK